MNDTTFPLVSIALCTYNGEKYLPDLLDSLVAQSYKNIEIVAVDDCSIDSTSEILTAYAANNSNIRVYRNDKNLGFIKNFEKAMGLCKGELIALCDQDDIWVPEKITLQVATIGDNMLIYHDSEFVDESNTTLNRKLSDLYNFYRGDQPEVLLIENFIPGHTMLFKKQLLHYALPLNEGVFHDWWLAYLAINHGGIDYVPASLVRYRQHSTNETNLLNHKETANLSWARSVRFLRQVAGYKQNKNPELVKRFTELYIGRLTSLTGIRLMRFMFNNYDLLLYVNKQHAKRKTRYLRKLFLGFKAKNFLYKYVSRNKDKIVDLSGL